MTDLFCGNKNGATITIFAPYDCKNNCPFCVNKKEYKDNPNFNLDRAIESLNKLHDITPRCDIVITGGEPFADCDKLKIILNKIRKLNANLFRPHRVFINTTLPHINREYSILDILYNYEDVITGLNVSRHTCEFVNSGGDYILNILDITIPIRINTVLTNVNDALAYKEKVYDKYKDFPVVKSFQIRDDYTKVHRGNLSQPSEEITAFLYNYRLIDEPTRWDANEFCISNLIDGNDFRWSTKINDKISYHRTLPYSRIDTFHGSAINDIIINPRGDILDDWNERGKPLNLKKYKEAIRWAKEVNYGDD